MSKQNYSYKYNRNTVDENGSTIKSEKRDSNPQPLTWQANTLPLRYFRKIHVIEKVFRKGLEKPFKLKKCIHAFLFSTIKDSKKTKFKSCRYLGVPELGNS